jgi:hypothetical protein
MESDRSRDCEEEVEEEILEIEYCLEVAAVLVV